MSESDIADLCRRIYQKHQRALDLIFEHRPDQQNAIRDALVERIMATPGLVLDHAVKSMIDFLPATWDATALPRGEGWTPSGRMLMFEFANEPRRLRLLLWIGPGLEEVRRRIFDRAQRAPFRSTGRRLGAKYSSIWGKTFLEPHTYEAADTADLIAEIGKQWSSFIDQDLPVLVRAITEESWLWPAGNAAPAPHSEG